MEQNEPHPFVSYHIYTLSEYLNTELLVIIVINIEIIMVMANEVIKCEKNHAGKDKPIIRIPSYNTHTQHKHREECHARHINTYAM